jgi:hypothetical protein
VLCARCTCAARAACSRSDLPTVAANGRANSNPLAGWEGPYCWGLFRSIEPTTLLQHTEALANAEIYDAASNSWVSAGRMAAARMDNTSTLLQDGRVLVVGGFSNDEEVSTRQLTTADIYDPATDRWTSVSSTERGAHRPYGNTPPFRASAGAGRQREQPSSRWLRES